MNGTSYLIKEFYEAIHNNDFDAHLDIFKLSIGFLYNANKTTYTELVIAYLYDLECNILHHEKYILNWAISLKSDPN
jgi:hypothetical protein